ncbi:MAG: hypothetical protein VSS75_008415 [Candidatus Parabeggiatoa sp.]|nr:hypothetical protein [Candidatus Parabeggiatoa sp.]
MLRVSNKQVFYRKGPPQGIAPKHRKIFGEGTYKDANCRDAMLRVSNKPVFYRKGLSPWNSRDAMLRVSNKPVFYRKGLSPWIATKHWKI